MRKTDFTQQEAAALLEVLQAENDVARLVDPAERKVYDNIGMNDTGFLCSKLWGRSMRCENCTSLRVLHSQQRAFKIEILNNRTYWVTSRFLRIDGKPFVLETANDVTDTLILDSNQQDEFAKLISNYNRQLMTDPLTGLYNRRFLDEIFQPALNYGQENNENINIAVMDIDDFKQVNDTYGHLAGDALLKDIAAFWKQHFFSHKRNEKRMAVRTGGDEMLIIVCGSEFEVFTREIADHYARMHKTCRFSETVRIPFSITIGTASCKELEKPWSWNTLLSLADQRMYDAKMKKKNLPKNGVPEPHGELRAR